MPVAVQRKGALIVRLLGRTVGRLDYSSRHNEMEYLADSMSMPLSRSLPLRSEPFDTETTTVFFENLLPPDQVRRKLGPILHVSRHNIFGFLEALGWDCAGAISLWPEDAPSEEESAAATSLREWRGRIPHIRIGCAKQAHRADCRWTDCAPAVRDAIDAYHKAACGGLCRQRFQRILLHVARGEAGTKDGEHQEDFCQALGVSGEMKYENEGGPSFASCMKAMQEMKFSLADRLAFMDRMIFNFLIGNADAHGKNSSILYRQKSGRSLAPIYDVMSTLVYPALSDDGAMSIGVAKRFADVRRDNFARMAREAGMRPALALGRLDAIASKILRHAESLAKELATECPSDVYAKIISVISSQLRQIAD